MAAGEQNVRGASGRNGIEGEVSDSGKTGFGKLFHLPPVERNE
jgi:hypothetical protein